MHTLSHTEHCTTQQTPQNISSLLKCVVYRRCQFLRLYSDERVGSISPTRHRVFAVAALEKSLSMV